MPGTWKSLADATFNVGTMLLLTDGKIMCQDCGSGSGSPNWYVYKPDGQGDYINGTWSPLMSGPNSPHFFASAVMKDGRVFVAGGEYNGSSTSVDLLAAQIYDPLQNRWTSIATPQDWTLIGDAASCMLADGTILLGAIPRNGEANGKRLDNATAIYDPVANQWHSAAFKNNSTSNEETWTLLPDGTVLTIDCFDHPQAERYLPSASPGSTGRWIDVGPTPVDLVDDASKEIGPAVLLPNGAVFAIGATSSTLLYTPPTVRTDPGSWSVGPNLPTVAGQQLIAKDAPACLLPNGKVLCALGPIGCGTADCYSPPTYFYEYDYETNAFTSAGDPPNKSPTTAPFAGRFLLLPTGKVLYCSQSTKLALYEPDGAPKDAWRPTITSVPKSITPGTPFTLSGTQLNGLSQAVSYGDDAQMATNYPIVAIRDRASKQVTYCRTSNHSTMGVATGAAVHTTNAVAPNNTPKGDSEIFVIANGIPSVSKPIQVQ